MRREWKEEDKGTRKEERVEKGDTPGKESHHPGDEGDMAEAGVTEDHSYHKCAITSEDAERVVPGAEEEGERV